MPSVNNPNPPNTYIALTKCWSKNFKLRRKSITLNSGIFVLAARSLCRDKSRLPSLTAMISKFRPDPLSTGNSAPNNGSILSPSS